MKPRTFLSLLLCLISIFAISVDMAQGQSGGRVITVNDIGDSIDAAAGDGVCADAAGKCTLRAAIEEANASPATDAIVFDVPVPAVITLDLGELKVTSPLGIFGRGARRLTIQRNPTPNFSAFRVFNLSAYTLMRGVTISNGLSYTTGGGILVQTNANFFDVGITGNTARAGGGIAIQGSMEVYAILERCLINDNVAYEQGGGMYVAPGSYPRVRSVTLTNNSAMTGGAIVNYSSMFMISSTLARNTASGAGPSSILNGPGGLVSIINTVIGPDTGDSSVSGYFFSDGSNLVTNTTGSTGWIGSDITSTNNGIDPLLSDLADNGGQTDTLALMSGSPAIDSGDPCVISGCPHLDYEFAALDQRKYPRHGQRPDIGAYEYDSAPDLGVSTSSLFFGMNDQRLAYSRVIVTNTETMERRPTFIALWDDTQMRAGGTRPLTFEKSGVYLAEIMTKRHVLYTLFSITSDEGIFAGKIAPTPLNTAIEGSRSVRDR